MTSIQNAKITSVMPISPGIAIGPARIYKPADSMIELTSISPEQVRDEQQRLREAIHAAVQELQGLSERVAKTVGRPEAEIFEAQQLMLEDPDLLDNADARIAHSLLPASAAFRQAAEEAARELEALEDETLAARAADVRDVASRVARHLSSSPHQHAEQPSNTRIPALVVARDLTPSDTATFDPETILGICTVAGGPTTHAAIIARALEIPAVAGLDARLLDTLEDGQQIAIDGARGIFYQSIEGEQEALLHDAMLRQREERAQ